MSPLPSGEWYNQHEDRLLRLENQNVQILSALPRIEQVLEDLGSRLKEGLDELKGEVVGIKENQVEAKDQAVVVATRLATVEAAEASRRSRGVAVAKWMGGVLATLVAAVLLTLLKLK